MTRFSSVFKGKKDIRMVYDGTGSGLNNYLWSPSFGMPMIYLVLRGVVLESYFGDSEVGETFLNFPLSVSLRPYCGVALTNIYS